MTVYFIRKIASPTEIKIGSANNVETRLTAIAREVGPVHYFASLAGGMATERKIQMKFAELRIEGEWFNSSPDLETYIRLIGDAQDKQFASKSGKWRPKAVNPVARRESDARVAAALLRQVYERYPRQTPVHECLDRAFTELNNINDAWSRRRVRALHELHGLRVDLFEIIDLLTILKIPRAAWAEWISPASEKAKVAA